MKISVFFKKRYLLKIPKNSDKKEVLGGSPLFNNKVIEKNKNIKKLRVSIPFIKYTSRV